MCRCTVTGITVEGGLKELIPEYQQTIVDLRRININGVLGDLDNIYSTIVSQYGDQGTKEILSLIDTLQNKIEERRDE